MNQPLATDGSASVPTSHRLLVVESEAKHLRTLTKTLRATVGEAEARASLGELPADGEYDLLLLNYDTLSPEEREAVFKRFGVGATHTRLLLLSSGVYREDLVDLFSRYSLTNMMGKADEAVDPEELIVTTRKILKNDIFGIEKYFIWGVEPITLTVSKTSDKEAVIAAAEAFGSGIGVNPRFLSQFCSIADELVTNALYNAPVDKEGHHRFASVARSEQVQLDPGEELTIKICCDGRRLGISASDPFGSLTVRRVLDYLAKCLRKGADQVDDKAGGAGLGLYYVFDGLSHFAINLHPGHRTEVIGIIDVSGSYRDFSRRGKSFNVFVMKE